MVNAGPGNRTNRDGSRQGSWREQHLGYRVFCRVVNFFDHWIGSEGPAGPVRDRVRATRWRANPVRLYCARAARRLGRSIRRPPGLRGGNGGRGAGHLSPLAGRKLREIGRATSELQSLMRISYAVFFLKKKKT